MVIPNLDKTPPNFVVVQNKDYKLFQTLHNRLSYHVNFLVLKTNLGLETMNNRHTDLDRGTSNLVWYGRGIPVIDS